MLKPTTCPAPSGILEQLESTTAWLAESRAAGSNPGDAARAMSRARSPKLNAEQRAAVRSLVEDGGYTRAEAVAWVLEMEGA